METDWVHINGWEIALVGKVSQRFNSKPCYIPEWFLVGPFEQVNQYKSLKGLTAPSKEAFFFPVFVYHCCSTRDWIVNEVLLHCFVHPSINLPSCSFIGSSSLCHVCQCAHSSEQILLEKTKWVEIPSKNISDKAFFPIEFGLWNNGWYSSTKNLDHKRVEKGYLISFRGLYSG